MKRLMFFGCLMVGLLSMNAYAQDTQEEVTEEEMMKFAVMEESVAAYLNEKQENLIDMIKNDETLGGAARYNEIKAAWGKEDKLGEINVTAEEREAFQTIQSYVDSLGKDVVKYKTDLIMDQEVLGAATYNKVKKAMDSDPTVKEKVDTMIVELKEKRVDEDGL
jgi:hypothetical protein